MLLLTVFIALTNLALGYAMAVYLGWASWPTFAKTDAPAQQPPASPRH